MAFSTLQQKLNEIEALPAYRQIMADSYGGIMYDVANRYKYDIAELFTLWHKLDANEQDIAGGIMGGAIDFLEGAI